MKKQIVKSEQYILEPQDIKVLKYLLGYCFHRATQHKTPISDYKKEILRLRGELSGAV